MATLKSHENKQVTELASKLVLKWKETAKAGGAMGKKPSPPTGTSSLTVNMKAEPTAGSPMVSTPTGGAAGAAAAAAAAGFRATQEGLRGRCQNMFFDLLCKEAGASLLKTAADVEAEKAAAALQPPQDSSSTSPAPLSRAASAGSGAAAGAEEDEETDAIFAALLAARAERQAVSGGRKLTEAELKQQAGQVAVEIETALFAVHGGPYADRPDKAYREKMLLLLQNLPHNRPLLLNTFQRLLDAGELVRMRSEDMASEEARKAAELARKQHQESVMLDWQVKNKMKALQAAGLTLGGGICKCPRCKSENTSYTEKQTRSADEPTTKFALCDDCGKRWRFE